MIPETVTAGNIFAVTSIGGYAFSNCNNLSEIAIPNSVTSIGSSAFYNCSGLTSVTIPNSVTSIGEYAFENCSGLTSVTIGNSVNSIGNSAFSYCSGLTTINFNATNCASMGESSGYYAVFGGCTSLSTLNIGENVTNIPEYAFYGCSGLTTVTIPNSVTSIGDYAFYNCSGLTSVTLPNSVTTIGRGAFYMVKNIVYQGTAEGSPWGALTLNGIIDDVFIYSDAAKTNLTAYIGSGGDVTIPNSVTSIGNYAFSYCSGLTSVTIPKSVTSIDNYAFSYCSGLTTVNFNATNCTSMGGYDYMGYVFQGCTSLSTLNIGENVTNIPDYAFYGCSGLTSVTIPESVTNIGAQAFLGCSGLTTVNFNATNCTTMGSSSTLVFNCCTSFTTLNIGENVTNIPANAFTVRWPNGPPGCGAVYRGLTSITSLAITPPQAHSSIGNLSDDVSLYVPCATKQAYQNAGVWNSFTNIQIIEGETFQYTASVSVTEGSEDFGSVEILHQPDCEDASFSIEATPIEHYHFVSWSDGSVNNPYNLIVVSDTALIAYFQIETDSLSLSANNSAMGTVFGEGAYGYGSTVEITANPNYGYHFVQWDDGNTDNPRTITVLQDTLFTAIFDNNEYEIIVLSDSLEMGTVSGGETYRYLDDISIEATANDGYIFVRWNDGNTENPRSIVVERDSTFTATFGILNEIAIADCNNYDLGGGYDFYETGTHYGFFTNAEGVDSVVRLILTIEQPLETTLRVVATNNENRNVVTWNSVSNNTMLGYLVYRQNAYGEFEVVDSVAIDAECTWTDEQSNTAVRPYRYAVATYDSCGNISAMSASHRTIHLQISLAQGNARNLSWTDYEGINFSTYRVYRGTEIGNMEMVMEMSAENHTYTDFDVQHDYFYQIEIVQGMKSVVISRSNIVSTNPGGITDIDGIDIAEISLFPNPATDILNITSSETISSVEIVNTLGQVVYRAEVNADNAVCDVEGLSNGVYVVRIHSRSLSGAEGAVIQQKFIKE